MYWFDNFEKKFSKFSIPYFFYFILCLQIIGFFIIGFMGVDPSTLILSKKYILNGEYWRLLSFLMMPSSISFLYLFFIYIFFIIGNSLTNHWGESKLSFFLTLLYLLTVSSAFLHSYPISNWHIFSVLFLAFSTIFSDVKFHLFFVIPMKVKWLGWMKASYMLLMMSLPQERWSIIASFIVYVLFFYDELISFLGIKNK